MPAPNLRRIPGDDEALAAEALGRAGEVIDGPFLRTLDARTRLALGRYGARSPSLALRQQSQHLLRTGLLASSIAAAADSGDARDLMVGLALHFDAAQRLGLDPAAVFDAVAAQIASPETSSLLKQFGHRDDITLDAFGWRLVEASDGPDYEVT